MRRGQRQCVLSEMKKKVEQFDVLNAPPQMQNNPRILELGAQIEQIEAEIEKLLDRVSEADSVLMGYINRKVSELHNQSSELKREMNELEQANIQPKLNVKQIRNCMQHWEKLEFDDKRAVVDQLIAVIKATENTCEITWKV